MNNPAKTDSLSFDEYINFCDIYSRQVGFLKNFLRHVFLKKSSTSDLFPELVGSARKRQYAEHTFWGPVSNMSRGEALDSFYQSDYDFALKLDSFTIEALLTSCPSLQEEKQKDADSYDQTGLLKCVYTTTVGALVTDNLSVLQNLIAINKRSSTGGLAIAGSSIAEKLQDMPEFMDQKVQFLFVKDLDAICRVWEIIDTEAFANYYWKRSPTFIGKDALKCVFRNFEDLAVTKKSRNLTLKAFSSGDLVADELEPGPIMWQPQAAPAVAGQFFGQAVGQVWHDEAIDAAIVDFVEEFEQI